MGLAAYLGLAAAPAEGPAGAARVPRSDQASERPRGPRAGDGPLGASSQAGIRAGQSGQRGAKRAPRSPGADMVSHRSGTTPAISRGAAGRFPAVRPEPGVPGPSAGGGGSTAIRARPVDPAQALAERTQAAFKQRRKAARRAAALRAARWTAPFALVAAVLSVVYLSPVFAVRAGDIEIRGLGGWIDRTEVADVLSLDVGVPLARLDTGRVVARLEALSAVETARVVRDWPTGLVVDLAPRVAAAAVLDGDSYVLLDSGAAQVARVESPPDGLPVIEVPLTESNQRTVKAVLAVASSLPESLATQIATIGAVTEDTVAFTLASGVEVVWGSAEDAPVKAAAVEILLQQPDVALIDVSAAESPVVR